MRVKPLSKSTEAHRLVPTTIAAVSFFLYCSEKREGDMETSSTACVRPMLECEVHCPFDCGRLLKPVALPLFCYGAHTTQKAVGLPGRDP